MEVVWVAEVFSLCCTHALTTETEEIMGLLLGDIHVSPSVNVCVEKCFNLHILAPNISQFSCLLMANVTHTFIRDVASTVRAERQSRAYLSQCHRFEQTGER